VIIDDLNIKCVSSFKPEADAPLIIDANAVLSQPVAVQGFQPVAWRHSQVIHTTGNLQLSELSPGYGSDVNESPDTLAPGQGLGLGAPERPDHAQ
jgi:hypothetical protein